MKFYEISMKLWNESAVHVSKKWKTMLFDRKSKKSTFISIDKSLRNWLQNFWVNLEGFLLVVRAKSKKRNWCNFFTRVRRFCFPESSLFALDVKFKSHWSFQSKKGNVSWKKSPEGVKWSKFLPFGVEIPTPKTNSFFTSTSPKPCANQRFHWPFANHDFVTD